MKKKVVIIHTSFVSVNDLKDLFNTLVPEAQVRNIVDDSMLADVIEAGRLTESVTRRICMYAVQAEEMGADLIFNQCSSVGEAVDVARGMINIPYVKVDEPMAEEAVRIGGRISVVATVPTTLGPSVRLIQRFAQKAGRIIKIRECLVNGAFDVLMKQGDRERHNDMVLDVINSVAGESDAVVLAQGSMICLLPRLANLDIPVLSSPRSGVEMVRSVLGLGLLNDFRH